MLENITNFDFSELNKFNKVFCLVSGGIDSTYLFEMCKQFVDSSKLYAVNCFNPLESNATLKEISQYPNFISTKNENIDYFNVLKHSFENIPLALQHKKNAKKFLGCCRVIKHDSFNNNPIFKEENTVVISGIKLHDGFQRNMWLKSLVDGKTRSKGTIILNFPTFYYKHKTGELYCYPFRDFPYREFPENILSELRIIYPKLSHSGCYICPILVIHENRIRNSCIKINDIKTLERLEKSVKFYQSIQKPIGIQSPNSLLWG